LCFLVIHSICFFFSSRRRHTRSKRDWSSDVCSSDLVYMPNPRAQYDDYVNGFQCSEREYEIIRHEMPESQLRGFLVKQGPQSAICELKLAGFDDELNVLRSEERRVGKGSSSQWRA